jgi:ArsR family transcriptional regulator
LNDGNAADAQSCAEIMKVLADRTRIAVVEELIAGPRRVHEINDKLKMEPTLFSHHLRVLREAGLVTAKRDGKSVVYALSPSVRQDSSPSLNFGCCALVFPLRHDAPSELSE